MMKAKRIYVACFSPTGLTRQVALRIAGSLSDLMELEGVKEWNFTLPSGRQEALRVEAGDWVVVGLPVYAGRLPNLLLPYLNSWIGNGAMAVPVVTFGNRSYGNALIELKELLELRGFHVMGAAAFVAEHAFAHGLAAGRPDQADLLLADKFADDVYMRWSKFCSEGQFPEVLVPGIGAPDYGGYYQPLGMDGVPVRFLKAKPVVDIGKCCHCGHCGEVCPMGAVAPGGEGVVTGICIKCNACIRECPENARCFTDEAYLSHVRFLETHYAEFRANVELF